MNELEHANQREQLIAAWASTWLTGHYREIQFKVDSNKKILGNLINRNIEKPLRKIVEQIRGKPYYYDFLGIYKF